MADLYRSESWVSAVPVESGYFQLLKEVVKIQLKQESGPFFLKSCQHLTSRLKLILHYPNDETNRMIDLQDSESQLNISRFPSALLFLELLGFQRLIDSDPLIIFSNSDLSNLKEYFLIRAVQVLETAEIKSQRFAAPAKPKAEEKLENKEKVNQALRSQMKEYRKQERLRFSNENKPSLHKNAPGFSPESVTYAQLYQDPNLSGAVRRPGQRVFFDIKQQEQKAFQLVIKKQTNEYRQQRGLSSLKWNDGLWALAAEHSRNMALGLVEFGHDGFNGRFKRFPFGRTKKGAENVGYYYGPQEPCVMNVNGWIQSPGHHKNIVGNFEFMGVACFVNDQGFYYFTQLFASART